MGLYIVICILIVLFAIFFTIYVINCNRFQSLIIKINEAEKNIGSLLREKQNLLLLINESLGKKESDDLLNTITNINVNELNNFELNSSLSKFDSRIVELRDFERDIELTEEQLKMFDDLENINVDCLASEKYYNDNVNLYNKLLETFPSSVVAKLKRFKHKEIYSNEKEEIFEILKK